jgi:hypothetical protein
MSCHMQVTGRTAKTLGLGAAERVTWAIPDGCSRSLGRLTIHSEEEFRASLECRGGTGSGIDFTKHDLHVEPQKLSPAAVGVEFFDDGTTLTTVSRQRCPSGPAPMPVTLPFAYLLPKGATRASADSVCLVEGACP